MALWPAVNAALNATSAALLLAGYWCIRRRAVAAHRACMVSAAGVSAVFFVSYLWYHSRVGSVRFTPEGWIRPVYFTILLTHTLLAIGIVPLALRTLYLGSRRRDAAHRALARWTLPLWLYVCVSGIVVYGLLYHV